MNPAPAKSTPPAQRRPEEPARLPPTVQVQLLDTPELRERAQGRLAAHHYLRAGQAVGEPWHSAVSDAQGAWVAVVIFAAAARHLRPREQGIGWSDGQRRRRLALVANTVRFLLLPARTGSNLGSAVLSRGLARLSDDWQARYAQPVPVVATFVAPARLRGTVYRASGWSEVGQTQGRARQSRDDDENPDQPKRLFGRELVQQARRSLQAEHRKPALAAVKAKVPVRSTLQAAELKSIADHFRAVPDYRGGMGQYPLLARLGIVACADLARAPRGQKDLAALARRLSSRQRAGLGGRRTASGEYPAPCPPIFCRLFARVSAQAIEQALQTHQAQVRGAPPKAGRAVPDGKVPGQRGGLNVVSAVTAPGLHCLGSEAEADKTDEIPAVHAPCRRLELAGRLVGIDAVPTQAGTARQTVLAQGGDDVMTVKANRPTLPAAAQAPVPDPGAPFLSR